MLILMVCAQTVTCSIQSHLPARKWEKWLLSPSKLNIFQKDWILAMPFSEIALHPDEEHLRKPPHCVTVLYNITVTIHFKLLKISSFAPSWPGVL